MDDREKRQRPSPLAPLITQWTTPSSTSLVFNDLSLKGQPGFHALIAGVSAYPHLIDGNGAPAPDNFGLQQLPSTASSAYKIYEREVCMLAAPAYRAQSCTVL